MATIRRHVRTVRKGPVTVKVTVTTKTRTAPATPRITRISGR